MTQKQHKGKDIKKLKGVSNYKGKKLIIYTASRVYWYPILEVKKII